MFVLIDKFVTIEIIFYIFDLVSFVVVHREFYFYTLVLMLVKRFVGGLYKIFLIGKLKKKKCFEIYKNTQS